MTTRRIAIDTWDPDYGAPVDAAVLAPSEAAIDPNVELEADAWRPIAPPADVDRPARIIFIDGVRRTDAWAWITEGDGPPFRAILASIAAGAALGAGIAPGEGPVSDRDPTVNAGATPGRGPASGGNEAPDGGPAADPGAARGRSANGRAGATPGGGTGADLGAAAHGPRARIVTIEVERLLIAPRPTADLEIVLTRRPDGSPAGAGQYRAVRSTDPDAAQLTQTVQRRLASLEARVARALPDDLADLIVVDGPLHGWTDARAIGYIKSHRVAYLPETLQPVIGHLQPGERTPIFKMTTDWSRYSWYLRLPGRATHAWWGIVRGEAPGTLSLDDARRAADRATAVLPRFASVPWKDPRAPQNLYPIAALERHLRGRLGDPAFVRRCLRDAIAPLRRDARPPDASARPAAPSAAPMSRPLS